MFAGRLLTIHETTGSIQLEEEAINFLQELSDPIVVVSLHGSKQTGKSSLLQDLLEAFDQEFPAENQRIDPPLTSRGSVQTDDVWLYIKRTNYSHARYIAFLDKRGFSDNEATEAFVYFLLSCISNIVIHNVMSGEISEQTIQPFTFLADYYDPSTEKNTFRHSPTLLWLLRDLTTTQFKEMLAIKNLPTQDAEQNYLAHVYRTLCATSTSSSTTTNAKKTSNFCTHWSKLFTNQMCLPLTTKPLNNNTSIFSSYSKRIDKINKFLLETKRNKYPKGIDLNGPLFVSVLVSMLAHRDSNNLFQIFYGKLWKETIHNCCLNIVEASIKSYKLRMSQQLPGILEASDLDMSRESLASCHLKQQELTMTIELPCEVSTLEKIHTETKRIAKKSLKQMPVKNDQLNQLLKKLFHDLVTSLYTKIKDENRRLSSELNQQLLKNLLNERLHTKEQIINQLKKRQEELTQQGIFITQTQDVKRFFYRYKENLQDMISEYIGQAKGPTKTIDLTLFLQNTIRLQVFEFNFVLQKICQQEIQEMEKIMKTSQNTIEQGQIDQQQCQEDTISVQSKLNGLLLENAKIQLTRKEALLDAIQNIETMHEMAKQQQQLLEEAALVSIQMPYEKVVQAAKESENTVFEGYLIKQGGGSTAFNPLGRKNWKQRYFILIGNMLIYAKTKDEYERGHIIKELCLKGCTIETAKDAGEGIDIIPPASTKAPHIFERQRGLFDKNSKKMSTQADFGRIFRLRAPNIETRNKWMEKLKQCTHPIAQTY